APRGASLLPYTTLFRSEEAGATVTIHAPGPCNAEVDARRIERIVRNLLTNAIEHSEGRPIDIWLASDDDAVAVAVRDHGVGFERSEEHTSELQSRENLV